MKTSGSNSNHASPCKGGTSRVPVTCTANAFVAFIGIPNSHTGAPKINFSNTPSKHFHQSTNSSARGKFRHLLTAGSTA